MTRPDADAIGDILRDVADTLLCDTRTVSLALKLDDIRRDIVRALSVPTARTLRSEAAHQASLQGAADAAFRSSIG